jgi:hypothetical protein
MASFAVDGRRQVMFATGIVDAVDEWADVQGKRTRTGAQAVTPEGVPVWGVEVTYRESSFGRESTVTAKVQVPLKDQPTPGFMSPIVFAGLVAEARVQRASGALITSWRADGIESSTPAHGGGAPAQGQVPGPGGKPEGGK